MLEAVSMIRRNVQLEALMAARYRAPAEAEVRVQLLL
jgi:hypothetical protein